MYLNASRFGSKYLRCVVSLCRLSNLRYSDSLIFIQEAAAIPFAALTAWRALRSTANIQKGYYFPAQEDHKDIKFHV